MKHPKCSQIWNMALFWQQSELLICGNSCPSGNEEVVILVFFRQKWSKIFSRAKIFQNDMMYHGYKFLSGNWIHFRRGHWIRLIHLQSVQFSLITSITHFRLFPMSWIFDENLLKRQKLREGRKCNCKINLEKKTT